MTELLTLKEIAAQLGLAYSTLAWKLVRDPDFPPVRGHARNARNGQSIRLFDIGEVSLFISRRHEKPKRTASTGPTGCATLPNIARDTGLSITALYYARTQSGFPRAVKVGSSQFYNTATVHEFMARRNDDDASNEMLAAPLLNTSAIRDWRPPKFVH